MRRLILAAMMAIGLTNGAMAQISLEKAMAPTASPVPCILPEGDKPPPREWSGSFDFGLNGTDGNADSFNMRLFSDFKRERPDSIWTGSFLYNYQTANSNVTAQNAVFNSRYDWLFANSPWSYFVSGGLQYDQFRAFDLLLFGHTGFGYTWIKDDLTLLKTRAGLGGSIPIGGPDEKFTPEALLGLDYERKVGDRSKFVFGATIFPDLSDFFEYRAVFTGAFETIIDTERNIGLKLGFIDNYFSQPQGRKANDLTYFAAITWKF